MWEVTPIHISNEIGCQRGAQTSNVKKILVNIFEKRKEGREKIMVYACGRESVCLWESRGVWERERESSERERERVRVMGWERERISWEWESWGERERERGRISWEGERVREWWGERERRSCEVLVVIKLSVIDVI